MSTIKPRSASVVIYQGDDMAVMAEMYQIADVADRKVKQAAKAVESALRPGSRAGDGDPEAADTLAAMRDDAQAQKDAYDAFVLEAAERAVEVVVQAIGNRRFRDLLLAHPARKVTGKDGAVTHEDDAEWDVDSRTFPDALLRFVDDDDEGRRTIATPVMGKKALAEFLDDEISNGDYEKLWQTAYSLNRGAGVDPKWSTFSGTSPRSEATLTSAPRLG